VVNRAQIIDDAINLAKSGHLDYQTALSVTGYLSKEVEYVPWVSALNGLSYINTMLKRTSAYGEFKKYMLRLVDPIYRKLGFTSRPDDTHLDILLRKKAVRWACSMGSADCQVNAKEKFNDWMGMVQPDEEKQNPVDVNMKYETYCNAISDGGEEEWDFAWKRYTESTVASEKSTLLSSLGCTKEVWLLNRYLNMSLTAGSGVRKQDGSGVIGSVARNTVGRYLAFDFIRDKWAVVKDYFSSGFGSRLGRVIKSVASSYTTHLETNQLKAFEAAHKSELGSSERAVAQAIEKAEANVAWMEANYQPIWSWLKQQNQES